MSASLVGSEMCIRDRRFARASRCSSPGGSSGTPPDIAGEGCSVPVYCTVTEPWRGPQLRYHESTTVQAL
eukprot:7414147-Alexandrium_andersonii.AAC.1